MFYREGEKCMLDGGDVHIGCGKIYMATVYGQKITTVLPMILV